MKIRLLSGGIEDTSSWITVNNQNRQLQALTWKTPQSPAQFSLEVTNSKGKSTEEAIEIQVVDNSESKPATNLFSLTLKGDYSEFEKDTKAQVRLYNNLQKAFPDGTKVSIRSVKAGSIVVSYSLDNDAAYSSDNPDACPTDLVQGYTSSTFNENGEIKDDFAESLGYEVEKVEFTPQGSCEDEMEPISAAAQKKSPSKDDKEGGNMTIIIIVIVVVLVLVIIIVIVIVCVIKKRKTQKANVSRTNGSYIEKGVPVVMDEEMKDVSAAKPLLTNQDSADVAYKPTPPAYPGDDKTDDKQYQPPTPPTSEPED